MGEQAGLLGKLGSEGYFPDEGFEVKSRTSLSPKQCYYYLFDFFVIRQRNAPCAHPGVTYYSQPYECRRGDWVRFLPIEQKTLVPSAVQMFLLQNSAPGLVSPPICINRPNRQWHELPLHAEELEDVSLGR